MMMRSGAFFPFLVTAALTVAAATNAQAESVNRTIVQEQPIETPAIHAVTVKTVIAPGAATPLHTHPGVEMAYILQGSAALLIKGARELNLSRDDSFSVPRDTVHSIRNTGTDPLMILSTYIVEKDRPLVIPAR